MENRLYVGNLPFSATDEELKQAFSAHGTVTEVALISDRVTGRSRGFAFVTMSSPDEANAAVSGMHGKDFGGRSLTVNIARPRDERGGGGGGGVTRILAGSGIAIDNIIVEASVNQAIVVDAIAAATRTCDRVSTEAGGNDCIGFVEDAITIAARIADQCIVAKPHINDASALVVDALIEAGSCSIVSGIPSG